MTAKTLSDVYTLADYDKHRQRSPTSNETAWQYGEQRSAVFGEIRYLTAAITRTTHLQRHKAS